MNEKPFAVIDSAFIICSFGEEPVKITKEAKKQDLAQIINPISPGQILPPPPPGRFSLLVNSITAQPIKMKVFKFNLTPTGVILHITTIVINLRRSHSNLLL